MKTQLFQKNLAKIITPFSFACMKEYFVYILTNKYNGTLYIGFTGDLRRRMVEHKEGKYPGFAKKYGLKKLVWYQRFSSPGYAITAEKKMKKWHRKDKVALIEEMNMTWTDLADPKFKPEDLTAF